jgi:hypothetical protein
LVDEERLVGYEVDRVSGVDDGWDRPKSRTNQAPKWTNQAPKRSKIRFRKMILLGR